jgi:general transcription factor 3C polypeptide 5 (transcription factor C subunit 1)
MHRQKHRQGHHLAWWTCQTKQGELRKHGHAERLLTRIQGLRSRLDSSAEGENDEGLKQLISVSLRPDDPFAKRLLSTAITTNNLLLKVTVPKRTGRKRKRGSSAPFLTEEELEQSTDVSSNGGRPPTHKTYVDASTIFQSLQDNASKYKVSLAGVIDETHRFRSRYQVT